MCTGAGKTKAPELILGLLKAWQMHLRLSFFTHSGILSHHSHLTLNRSMSLHYPLVVNPLRCCLRELVHVSVLSTSTRTASRTVGYARISVTNWLMLLRLTGRPLLSFTTYYGLGSVCVFKYKLKRPSNILASETPYSHCWENPVLG